MQTLLKRFTKLSALSIGMSLLFVGSAAAHVTVTPGEVITASRTTFAVSVPNESNNPVIEVRVLIPGGLTSVRPFAKTGWNLEVETTGEGENVNATEITWTSAGGTVPQNLKDDFYFGAKVPGEPTDLIWKSYETYSDGRTVGWDQEPTGAEGVKPWSVTRIVSETEQTATINKIEQATADASKSADRALYVAIIGAALGLGGLIMAMRRK